MRSIVLLIVLSLCLSNVDARKSLKNNNVKSVQPPISNCYLAATSSIYLGCQATATDLLSTASVILGGSVHVSGNVMARSVTIGSCSEIDGDVISHGKVREGSNVFVKGVTLENWPWNDWEVVGATTSIPAKPSSYPTSTSQLVIVDQQDLELEDQDTFGLILVRAGGNLVLPEGTIFVANLIIEDGATITGTDDSTVWISNTLNIGSDVVVENYVKFISQQDIVIGKRLCGPAQNVEKRSEMRKERIGRLEASSCPCEVLEVEQSCYCDTVANIDLFAYGTLNIGTDSGVSGAILANNLIAGSGLCATCTASPFKPTYKMETRPTPSPAPPASSGQASSNTPSE